MRVHREPESVPDGRRVVTIGVFDGVHLGHLAVLRLVRELADARGLAATVLTFDRHPAEVVRPESAPPLLTTLEQKLELLSATGAVDDCLVLTFDEARSRESAEQFVEEILGRTLGARVVVVGADFHFGYRRRGNVPLLQQMGTDLGFAVLDVGLVARPDGGAASPDAQPYSSTRVRQALLDGDVRGTAEMLDRPHEVRGPVEHGDGRGRDLGFPTANVAVPARICLPADGVYAGWLATSGGGWRPAALSLGRRPTFYADHGLRLLEAHVLDWEGDLYDRQVAVRFWDRIRRQERFEGPDAVGRLVEQMGRDVVVARASLAAVPGGSSGE